MSFRVQARNLRRFLQSFALYGMTILFCFSAHAENRMVDDIINEATQGIEVESTEFTYSPDYCDFEITFPETPFETKRCVGDTDKCYTLTNYTMVYELSSTVEVSASCVPSPVTNFDRYTEPVVRTVLKGMVERTGMKEPEISYSEEAGLRHGSLIGTALRGQSNQLYNAQIWIGPQSVMTIEARLTGRSHSEADTVFADILKTVKKK